MRRSISRPKLSLTRLRSDARASGESVDVKALHGVELLLRGVREEREGRGERGVTKPVRNCGTQGND